MQNTSTDPLHGKTLKAILEALIECYGWDEMGKCIRIKSFTSNPSVESSLKFLRKTSWAREKVEELYLKSINHSSKKNDAKFPDLEL